LGTNHPDVAQALNNLANDYQAEGNYDEAEVLHKRALAIRERALGTNHPDVAQSLYNLAFVERWQGKYDQAEGLFKRALAIEEVTLGRSNPETARTLQGLAPCTMLKISTPLRKSSTRACLRSQNKRWA